MQLDGGLHQHEGSGRAAPEGPTVVARGASPGTGVRNTVRPRGADEDCLSTIIGNASETVQDRTEPGVCFTTRIVHGVLALFSSAPLGRIDRRFKTRGLRPGLRPQAPLGPTVRTTVLPWSYPSQHQDSGIMVPQRSAANGCGQRSGSRSSDMPHPRPNAKRFVELFQSSALHCIHTQGGALRADPGLCYPIPSGWTARSAG